MDTKRSPELWDKLESESSRAFEAFKLFMYLPPAERSVAGAWREWTDNPEAGRPSPFFEGWAREYAWPERARAYDAHIERIRRRGMERPSRRRPPSRPGRSSGLEDASTSL